MDKKGKKKGVEKGGEDEQKRERERERERKEKRGSASLSDLQKLDRRFSSEQEVK